MDKSGVAILYQYEISPFCDKVRRVLNLKGIPFRVENLSLAQTAAGKLKKLNPAGKVPVLDLDGERICDSTDIIEAIEARYPEPALIPEDPRQAAQVHILEDWADESLYFYEVYLRFAVPENARRWAAEAAKEDGAVMRWLGSRLAPVALSRLAREQGIGRKPATVILRDLHRHFRSLEHMLEGDWLVGERISLADIAVYVQCHCIAVTPEGQAALEPFTRVAEWMTRVEAATDE